MEAGFQSCDNVRFPWWARPIGWPMFSGVGVVQAWLVWGSLKPSFYYMMDYALRFFMWIGIAVLYGGRWAVRWFLAISAPVPLSFPLATWRRDGLWFLVPVIVSGLIVMKVPLRISFLTALPGLTRLVEASEGKAGPLLGSDQQCGIFTISASSEYQGDRMIFWLVNDPDSAFIYSRNGIRNLRYNSGSKGHLFGNWYWMTED